MEEVKWGERKGKQKEASIKADRVLEACHWGRGRATCGSLWTGSWKPQVQSCGGLLTRNIYSCTDSLCKRVGGRA